MKSKLTSLILGTVLVVTFALGTEASAEKIEVKKGDTLWNIAQNNNITVGQLKKINNLTSHIIYPKQTLETSTSNNKTTSKKEETKSSTYIVKSGDSLSKIGALYGVKVNELKDWNNLSSSLIIVGQELAIKGDAKKTAKKSTKSVEKKSSTKQTKSVEKKSKVKENKPVKKTENKPKSGKTMTVEATAYTAECYGCSGVTATGIDLNKDRNKKVIAVDPSVIPLGSRVHVEGYGEAIAGDTGGAIKGKRIDLHVPTKSEAFDFGRRDVKITVLN